MARRPPPALIALLVSTASCGGTQVGSSGTGDEAGVRTRTRHLDADSGGTSPGALDASSDVSTIEPRDAGAEPDAEADAPDAPWEAHCQATLLTPNEVCAPGADCPVVFGGNLSCDGTGSAPEVVATPTHLYAKLAFGTRVPVLRLPVGPDELELLFLADASSGWLRLDGADSPVLVTANTSDAGTALAIERATSDAAARTDVPVPRGTPVDVLFDRDGHLHVFSFVPGFPDGSSYYADPGGGSLPIAGGPMQAARAVRLANGDVGFAMVPLTGGEDHLSLWSAKDGTVDGPVIPREPGGFFLGPAGSVAISSDATKGALASMLGENALWSISASEPQAAALFTQTPPPCTGGTVVQAPEVCPGDVDSLPGGERIASHAPVLGADRPYVAALAGDGVFACDWGGACFETLPCNCTQTGSLSFDALRIELLAGGAEPRTVRVDAGVPGTASLVATERGDGVVVVAAFWTGYDGRNPVTHLKYFGVDTR